MRWRSRRSGQAMVELAILVPLLMLLFMGAWTAEELVADNDTAIQGTRAGARYAAELGEGGAAGLAACQASEASPACQTDTITVDQDIIDQVLPIVTGKIPDAVVNSIDIYQPAGGGCGSFSSGTCPPDNGLYTGSEPVDIYTVSGSTASLKGGTTAGYTLDLRNQIHPNEAELGVLIQFTYTSPTLKMFSQTDSQYTVIRLAPLE